MHHCHLGKNPSEIPTRNIQRPNFQAHFQKFLQFSEISDLFKRNFSWRNFPRGFYQDNFLRFFFVKKLWCYLPPRRYTTNNQLSTIDVFVHLNLIGISPKIHDVYLDFHWIFSGLDQSHCTYLKFVCQLIHGYLTVYQ